MTLADLFQVLAIGSIAQYWYRRDSTPHDAPSKCLNDLSALNTENSARASVSCGESSEEKKSWFREVPKREWPERRPDETGYKDWSKQDGIDWISA